MNDIDRRFLIGGAALGSVGAASLAAGEQGSSDAPPASTRPAIAVATLQLLTGHAAAIGDVVWLQQAGRAGLFTLVRGGKPDGDPLDGLTIPSAMRGAHWKRDWDAITGRPEWFGAEGNNPAIDCAPAIEACYALCPVTLLGQADYFVRRTVRLARSWRAVRGAGRFAHDRGQGTRIVLHRDASGVHSDHVMFVGLTARPSSVGGLIHENHLSQFTLVRDGTCRPHPSGNLALYPCGLRVAYVAHANVSEIGSHESSVGFYIGGAVYSKFNDCMALRVNAGVGSGVDYAVGYYLDGHVSFGYPGGNASLYLSRCLALGQHASHVDATGLKADGGFVDTFLDLFECAGLDVGMSFFSDGFRSPGQTIDLHVRSPVLDGVRRCGIDLSLDATATTSVEIVDAYIAAGAGSSRGIAVRDGAGLVTINGGQIHGDFPEGSLYFSRTRGITVQGTKIHQSLRPLVASEARGLQLMPQITRIDAATAGAAVELRSITRSIVRPTLTGHAQPSFRAGIALDAATSFCEIDGSAIDPACLQPPDARAKVTFAGGDARGGASGQAFTAAGNRLVGVAD